MTVKVRFWALAKVSKELEHEWRGVCSRNLLEHSVMMFDRTPNRSTTYYSYTILQMMLLSK